MGSLNTSCQIDLESGHGNGGGGGGCDSLSSASKGGSSSSFDDSDGRSLTEETEHSSEKDSEKKRESSVSECSVEIDLEADDEKDKSHLERVETDCRICHLTLDESNQESGLPIELGCSCKEDLAAAHKQCAEAWFKIKGNRTCEICGSIARNVTGPNESELSEQWDEESAAAVTASIPAPPGEARYFWQGHRFLNFLLACMVFAFVISWLFHFNVPS